MYFHFGTKKIVEAAAVLLGLEARCRMSYLRLLKLLYIADRQSLLQTGRPIIGTRPVAMDHGPAHSEVLDLINGQHWGEPEWAEFIRKDRYEVELRKDPGVLSLSRQEIETMRVVYEQYRDTDDWEVVRVTHGFPEWKKHYREKTSTEIPFEDIIEAVGLADDREAILRDAQRTRALDELFRIAE